LLLFFKKEALSFLKKRTKKLLHVLASAKETERRGVGTAV
jgi:hypothetical protein